MPTQPLMRISYKGYWGKKNNTHLEDKLHQYDALDIQKLTNCTAYINFGSIMLTSCPNINGKQAAVWTCGLKRQAFCRDEGRKAGREVERKEGNRRNSCSLHKRNFDFHCKFFTHECMLLQKSEKRLNCLLWVSFTLHGENQEISSSNLPYLNVRG